MCGLVYSQRFDGQPVNNEILDRFDNQRHRGTEGFGLFDGFKNNLVRASKEDKILNWLVKYPSDLIMFHHRNPTSTINVKRAAHPISTRDHYGKTQYILIHNGMISNSRSLKEEHEKLGIKYYAELQDKTFNDSEALAWDVAEYLEGNQKSLEAYGMIAFICIKLNGKKLEKLYFGRNSNPLVMQRDKNGITLSSEGEGESIDSDTLYTWNYKLKRLTKKKLNIPRWYSDTDSYVPYNSDSSRSSSYTPGYKSPSSPGWGAYGSYDPLDEDYYDGYDDGRYNKSWKQDDDQEYEHNPETQALTPIVKEYNSKNKDGLSPHQLRILEEHAPLKGEIVAKVQEYLISCGGWFEDAYWAMEEDYLKMFKLKQTEENIDKQFLMEQALAYLNNDPEYIDDMSISTKFGYLTDKSKEGTKTC